MVVEGDDLKSNGASLQLSLWIRRNLKAQVFRVVGCCEGRKAALITTSSINGTRGILSAPCPLTEEKSVPAKPLACKDDWGGFEEICPCLGVWCYGSAGFGAYSALSMRSDLNRTDLQDSLASLVPK